MSDIGTNYTLQIEVLSPLHIGNGKKLQRDFDFIHQRGTTYRLNDEAILDALWPDDEAQQRKLLSGRLSDLIEDVDLSRHSEYVLYSFRGDPALNEINAHIKDVYGQAYLPGSSLKGALRTLLLRTVIEGVAKYPISRQDIGRAMQDERDAKAAKAASGDLERRFAVGSRSSGANTDSNYSLFRALSVGDSMPASKNALILQRINVVPGLDIDVEAIKPGTQLTAPMRVDKHLLKSLADDMGFDSNHAATVQRFVRAAHFTAETRIKHELKYHVAAGHALPTLFYKERLDQMAQDEFGKSAFLVQVGFMTGWRAKSLLGGIPNEDPLLEKVVHDFNLDRGGKNQAGSYEKGQNFPKARHLAYRGGSPAEPMGWLKVTAVRR